ncbi:hypothetical protein [Pollutimonas thiosulfatoxidans]|uniref:FAD-binding protein n=1 Tax=Pollutimonas thiosulfatoxidans TaxID=2028345 RepID=A0A410G8C8_9BURK|nr:hypothetical protein [Pollutimonas thiosulfatoxidans]QAA92564.1 hypothetical protein CKA81_00935 [Pollutimonas thiosulfatoxidans]
MQSNSRRAFLTGRRSSQTPWEAFCQRLRNVATGTFYQFEMPGGGDSARLMPKQASDVHHARALCAEYGVVFALDGMSHPARMDDQLVLWVEPGKDLGRCQRLEEGSTRWFVQPGCLLGDLVDAGLTQFQDLPCHISVAAWLADRTLCDWETGATADSGLVYASVLLADGTVAGLGPFGEANAKPLEGARLQRMVPALFQLAAGDHAAQCAASSSWPGRYRLDALKPASGQTPNLAHLLLGHGGDLGWVDWLVIDEQEVQPQSEPPYSQRFTASRATGLGLELPASELDTQVKALFDAEGLFPHPGQDL